MEGFGDSRVRDIRGAVDVRVQDEIGPPPVGDQAGGPTIDGSLHSPGFTKVSLHLPLPGSSSAAMNSLQESFRSNTAFKPLRWSGFNQLGTSLPEAAFFAFFAAFFAFFAFLAMR